VKLACRVAPALAKYGYTKLSDIDRVDGFYEAFRQEIGKMPEVLAEDVLLQHFLEALGRELQKCLE